MINKTHSSYLKRFSIVFLLLILAFGGLNYLIDPYGLFGTSRVDGLSKIKPAAATHLRLSKPYQVRRYQPKTLIAGNSRPEMGMDPAHACWPDSFRPVYNLGLPGVGVYRQARSIQHAIYNSDVRLILWGVDFSDFLSTRHKAPEPGHWPPAQQTYESNLVVTAAGEDNRHYRVNTLKTYLETLISLDTTSDSLMTILQQGNQYSSNRLENGFNPAKDYVPIIRNEGQQVLFQQKMGEIERRFSRPGQSVLGEAGNSSKQFRSLAYLLNSVDKQKTQVYLFINPYHVEYLRAIHSKGLWEQFEQWKLRLLAIADQHHAPLWDFSIITPYNSEPAPASATAADELKWFWEPAHYKQNVGSLMLASMVPGWCQKNLETPVGVKLNSNNIDSVLKIERLKIGNISTKVK